MPEGTSNSVVLSRNIQEYVNKGGFRSLANETAASIRDKVRAAKLRGRGGSGKYTAEKWDTAMLAAVQRDGPTYLVCNAYDADPQALAAANLMVREPFAVLEGIALTARAVGAKEVYFYFKAANHSGYDSMLKAYNDAQSSGYLNTITINFAGADAGFMGGEESVMLEILRGRRAMAVQRPPYPAQIGLYEYPTVIDNIETLYTVTRIINPAATSDDKKSGGNTATYNYKLLTLYGLDGKPVIVEAAFGSTIAQIFEKSNMALNPNTVRAVVVGGPEGGVLGPQAWNTPYDYETLAAVNCIVGSGVIEVIPAQTCMVEWARKRMEYLSKETCGKCVPCRVGVKRAATVLATMTSNVAKDEDMATLTDLLTYIPRGSLCGFGWNASRAAQTAQTAFPEDFSQHMKGECPFHTCAPQRSHRYATKGVL